MINTVLQAIERFESSPRFESSHLPTPIYDNNEADDTSILVDTEEDTSDESDEYKDAEESSASEEIKFHANPIQIKQTLKDKIRIRRESEGAGEIVNLFEPPRQYKLTPEEEVKNEIRKQRNRRSATKSRLKRIAKEKQLEKDAVELEAENEKWTQEVKVLKKVKLIYSLILKRHLPSCPKVATALNSSRSVQNNAHNAPVSTAAVPTACMANGIVGDNSMIPSLQSPLLTPQVDTHISVAAQHLRQSSQINWPMKRKAADEEIEQPRVLHQTETTNSKCRLVSTVSETCQSNALNEVWQNNTCTTVSQNQTSNSVQSVSMTTGMDINCNIASESVLCEIPSTCCNIQQPLLATSNNHGQSIDESEEQKINQIKQHLLDGFPMASHR